MNKLLLLSLLFSLNCFAKDITAKSYIVTNNTGDVLSEKDADQIRSIASITKMMTVLVVLDSKQNLNEDIPITFKNRAYLGSHLPHSIKSLSRQELIDLAMVKSDNLAAYTLCENYSGGMDRCISAMNNMADSIGMKNTHYEDPTGLNPNNVSTARDLIKLVLKTQEYPDLMDSGSKSEVNIKVKQKWHRFGNTNPLVRNSDDVKISKTGYIHQSGGCVVMLLDTDLGQRVVALLGSKNTRTRFTEAKKVIST